MPRHPGSVIGVPAERCLLTVHAHPDDEASKGAGTVARYHAEGVHTVLVCCTDGAEGEILNPALDTPEVRAGHRRRAPPGARRRHRRHRLRRGGDARLPRFGHGRLRGQRQPGLLRRRPAGRGDRPPGGDRPAHPAPGDGDLRGRPVRLPAPGPPPGPRGRSRRLPAPPATRPATPTPVPPTSPPSSTTRSTRPPGSGPSTTSSWSWASSRRSTTTGGPAGTRCPTRCPPRWSTSPGTPDVRREALLAHATQVDPTSQVLVRAAPRGDGDHPAARRLPAGPASAMPTAPCPGAVPERCVETDLFAGVARRCPTGDRPAG